MELLMLTRRWMAVTAAALAFLGAGSSASAAERALLGVVLGRSYRQVLGKFGTPNRVQPVMIPVPGQQTAGYDPNNPAAAGGAPGYAAPGYGAPGGAPGGGYAGAAPAGGPPGYGAPSYGPPGGASTGGGPAGYGGAPSYGPPGGASTGGGPPMLPPVGGAPGAPGYGGGYGDPGGAGAGAGGLTVTGVGNGAEWIYNRPGGVTLAFIINEDGRVAQISVSSSKPYPAARTSRGVGLGADYSRVLMKYGYPERQLVGGYFVEAYYPKNHHAAFTFVQGKLVRITIALAD
jgi:hypothetical protein